MKRAFLCGLALVTLAGCTSLPGGEPSGPSYSITVEFADVLDLVPQSAVKVDDVTVGSVTGISLSGWTARVHLKLAKTVQLPANATAAIRQTSLLGEKFVDVAAPVTEAPSGRLADGATIPLSRTRRAAEVEEVLAALGLLLNGGGLAQLKTITRELGRALGGREAPTRDALHQLDAFLGGLDAQKADIVRAIDAMDRLSGRLARQREVIGGALDRLAPGITVLEQQRGQLTAAVTALGELGRVGTRVVNASRDDTAASLRALRPILDKLVEAGDALPKSLDFMLTYPFPPNVTGAIVGDFVNLRITADLDAASILANLVVAAPRPAPRPSTPAGGSSGGGRRPAGGGAGPALPKPPKVLPPGCVIPKQILPPKWTPPAQCGFPLDCFLLPAGGILPVGGLLAPGGALPVGTVFPAGTKLPKGTILSPGCLLAPITGAVDGVIGGLGDVLNGGLVP